MESKDDDDDDDDDDAFRFINVSTYRGHLHRSGRLPWFCIAKDKMTMYI